MQINRPSNDIINISLHVPVKGRSREDALIQDITEHGLDKNSIWRKPVTHGIFWEKILRPICNLFQGLQKWCQYQDFKHNLSALRSELRSKETIPVAVEGMNSPDDTKKIFHVYTKAIRQVITTLDSKKQSELRSLIDEIDTLVDAREFTVSLPKELQEIKNLQKAIQDDSLQSIGVLREFEERAKKLPGYSESTLENEIRLSHCLLKAKELASEIPKKTASEFLVSAEAAQNKLMAYTSFTKLDSKNQEATLSYFKTLIQEPLGTILKQEEQKCLKEGQTELTNLKKKIEANSFSQEELTEYQNFIRTKLAELDAVNNSVISRYNEAKPTEKAAFFENYIQERLKQNRQVAASLVAIDKLLSQKISAPTVDGANRALASMSEEPRRDIVDITAIAKKSGLRLYADGAKDAIISTAAWATGSRDMLATSSSTYGYAMQAIGSAATFVIYASLGALIGKFGNLGSIAYGIGAVSISAMLPQAKKDLLPNASKTVQLLTGPLIMASYALIAPAVYAAKRDHLTPLRQAQGTVTKNIHQVKTTIDTTHEHATALNKTIPEAKTAIDNISTTTREMQSVSNNMKETLSAMKEDVTSLRNEIPLAQKDLSACKPDTCAGVVQNITNRVQEHIVGIDQKAVKFEGALHEQLDLNKNLQGNLTVLDQKNTILQSQVCQLQEDGRALLANNTKLQESVANLENIINPQRSFWNIFSDTALGGAVGAAGVGLLFIPGFQAPGALLISAGAGYAAGLYQ